MPRFDFANNLTIRHPLYLLECGVKRSWLIKILKATYTVTFASVKSQSSLLGANYKIAAFH